MCPATVFEVMLVLRTAGVQPVRAGPVRSGGMRSGGVQPGGRSGSDGGAGRIALAVAGRQGAESRNAVASAPRGSARRAARGQAGGEAG